MVTIEASPVPTRSPIIEPGLIPAALTATAAGLLALAPYATLPALQVLTAAGWFRLHGMWPARQGIALAVLTGFAADAALALGGPSAVFAALGAAVPVLLLWGAAGPERFSSLTVLVTAAGLTGLCATLPRTPHLPAALAAVALAVLLAAAHLPAVLALAGATVATALLTSAPPQLLVVAAAAALIGRRVASYDFPSRFVHHTAGVALPLALAAPLLQLVP
ncbi:hypothetical protein CFP65_4320 [Kitasatospora sp. MMS16-BH015]|uniref:hypothetical protein n=1 Tax=Kitasatospora sp. MMS16-BH015 TaxID=2018025 RepID=UPI000CA23F99|nr:hypothetical protein [Kitasatospora sp. MMS16-BH015]AUG79071.1 hypothetical protein CFP65_4320 [Kitasatospora sp. MMS16-BH015]